MDILDCVDNLGKDRPYSKVGWYNGGLISNFPMVSLLVNYFTDLPSISIWRETCEVHKHSGKSQNNVLCVAISSSSLPLVMDKVLPRCLMLDISVVKEAQVAIAWQNGLIALIPNNSLTNNTRFIKRIARKSEDSNSQSHRQRPALTRNSRKLEKLG